jgi:predicted O-methyltransferase YrrM
MHLVNEQFEKLLDNHYLTENVSLLIYSLIKTTRPLKVIEFGAGYSTICIAKAFQDIQKEEFNPIINPEQWDFFRKTYSRNSESVYRQRLYEFYKLCFVEDSLHTGKNYNPSLTTIDNSAEVGVSNSYNSIPSILEELNLSQYVKFVNSDWMDKIKNLGESDYFDFIWIDIGSGLEYKEIFDLIFPKLNSAGILAFHNVATNVASRYFLAEMKLKCKLSDEFEMMTLWEPHKKRQNSIVLFKKTCDYPIFEMLAK